LTLEVVRNVSRGTDNIPADFGASVTFTVELWVNVHQTNDMTLPITVTFDL